MNNEKIGLNSLRWKFTVYFLLIALIPLIILGVFLIHQLIFCIRDRDRKQINSHQGNQERSN